MASTSVTLVDISTTATHLPESSNSGAEVTTTRATSPLMVITLSSLLCDLPSFSVLSTGQLWQGKPRCL